MLWRQKLAEPLVKVSRRTLRFKGAKLRARAQTSGSWAWGCTWGASEGEDRKQEPREPQLHSPSHSLPTASPAPDKTALILYSSGAWSTGTFSDLVTKMGSVHYTSTQLWFWVSSFVFEQPFNPQNSCFSEMEVALVRSLQTPCQATLWPSCGGQSSSPDWVPWEPEGGGLIYCGLWASLLLWVRPGRRRSWMAWYRRESEGWAGGQSPFEGGGRLQRWGNTSGPWQSADGSSEDWSQRLTATPAKWIKMVLT